MSKGTARYWIKREDMAAFRAFCEANGYATRDHTDSFRDGIQIRHNGHWMALVWNKSWKRYSADARLGLIVQSFAHSEATNKEQQ